MRNVGSRDGLIFWRRDKDIILGVKSIAIRCEITIGIEFTIQFRLQISAVEPSLSF